MVAKKTHAHPENGDEKFRELILYLARNSEDDPKFGATKLNKLLFFCDFLAYRSFGASITGQDYQRLAFGPAPRRVVPVCEELAASGACVVRQEDRHGYPQKRLIALRAPRMDAFSAREIDLVRNVLDELWNSNTSEVSELSHTFLGWQVAGDGETIPYATILLSPPRPLNDEEQDWANQAIDEYLSARLVSSPRPD